MTGIEKLREWAQPGKEGCPPMSGGIDSDKCREFNSCNQCRVYWLRDIADQIERETLPRPLFEDGEPVQLGDGFQVGRAVDAVESFKVLNDASWIAYGKGGCSVAAGVGEPLKRPAPEVLDADGVPIEVGDAAWSTNDSGLVGNPAGGNRGGEMRCPMNQGRECLGRDCAWWVQRLRRVYSEDKDRFDVVGIEAEGCAVALAVTGGTPWHWVINDGSAE